jgi:dTDP-glucose 4,6-dehydratase
MKPSVSRKRLRWLTIVRIFNTYGPRMRLNDGRVVPAFISQALKNKPLTVFGKGNQTRSFCYVSDLVEGIYRLMMSDYALPVNIGNPTEMTMLEFAKEIIRATNSRSKISFKPLPQDDPKQRKPNITRAKKILRWQPKVNLAEGLVKTIEYFRTKV